MRAQNEQERGQEMDCTAEVDDELIHLFMEDKSASPNEHMSCKNRLRWGL